MCAVGFGLLLRRRQKSFSVSYLTILGGGKQNNFSMFVRVHHICDGN